MRVARSVSATIRNIIPCEPRSEVLVRDDICTVMHRALTCTKAPSHSVLQGANDHLSTTDDVFWNPPVLYYTLYTMCYIFC